LSLEQTGPRTNYYALGFGNGREWMAVADFFLSPDDLHYIAVTKEQRHLTIYLDGRSIVDRVLEVDLAPSDLPLMIGNWFMKNRPFNGLIQEVRLARTAVSARAIANKTATLRSVLGALALPRDPFPTLGKGFYGWEGDWRQGAHTWSRGKAELILNNPTAEQIERSYSFVLSSLSSRQVTISMPSETKTVDLVSGKSLTAGPFTLSLKPGQTAITFGTDKPADLAGPGDARRIAFALTVIANQ
jgi:hypothetical protein